MNIKACGAFRSCVCFSGFEFGSETRLQLLARTKRDMTVPMAKRKLRQRSQDLTKLNVRRAREAGSLIK
jgi:hypothetical protein